MANGHDRFDNVDGGSFVIGVLAGAVVGVGLGMLFAPKAGSELRNQLSEQAGALANQAQEGYRKATKNAGQWAEKGKQAAGEWADRGKDVGKDMGKDMYGKARDAVSLGADEAQKYARDAASAATDAAGGPRRS